MRGLAIASAACWIWGAAACSGAAPEVRGDGEQVVPDFSPPRTVSLMSGPSSADDTSVEESSSDSGYCLEWVTEKASWDPQTGEWEYLYRCVEGGDIETSHSFGTDDGSGNGTYQIVYAMRDGSQVVWDFTYETNPMGTTQWRHGASSEGESAEIEYHFMLDGSIRAYEVWTMEEGVYITDGVYETDGRFNGGYSFDDPATSVSPDWLAQQTQAEDLTLTQVVHSVFDGWVSDYTYVVHPDNSATFNFEYDDMSTLVDPDYSGAYLYGADGSANGGYTQLFDDGSVLEVEQSFNVATAGYSQSWTFDDAATAQPVDQEGSLTVDASGNGSGTITTYIQGGGQETCDITVQPDGSTLIDNCR